MEAEREYWSNGNLRYEWPRNENGWHGICRYFRENGQIEREYSYQDGKYHGVSRYWNQYGQFEGESYYLYGKEVSQEEYRHYELVKQLAGISNGS